MWAVQPATSSKINPAENVPERKVDVTGFVKVPGENEVKVVVTGKLKVQSVEISPDAVNPEDVDMLQDLVMAAINEALDKAQELAQSRLGAITGGMKIPGLM